MLSLFTRAKEGRREGKTCVFFSDACDEDGANESCCKVPAEETVLAASLLVVFDVVDDLAVVAQKHESLEDMLTVVSSRSSKKQHTF